MAWLLISKRSRRWAVAWTLGGIGTFAASLVFGGLAVAPGPVAWTTAGFVSFVLCVGRALKQCRADEMVFEHRRQWRNTAGEADSEPFPTLPRRPEPSSRVGQLRHV